MSAPEQLDLDAIADRWLRECGPHDYGINYVSCNCPDMSDTDPRTVIAQLVNEVERLRAALGTRSLRRLPTLKPEGS